MENNIIKHKHITFIVLIICIFCEKLFEGDQEKNDNKRSKKFMFESIIFYFNSKFSFLLSFIFLFIKYYIDKKIKRYFFTKRKKFL